MGVWLPCTLHFLSADRIRPADLFGWWQIYKDAHHVSQEAFFQRIRTFDRLILIRDRVTGQIVGGSGYRVTAHRLASGERITLIYVGQGYILTAFRGKQLTGLCYALLLVRCKLTHPRQPVWFWFDALSYKPYLLMAKHLREFYPARGRRIPTRILELREYLGQAYYAGMHVPDSWVIKKPELRLKAGHVRIGEKDLQHPDIRFYAGLNPGNMKGDGLLCLIPGKTVNLLSLVRSVLKNRKGNRHAH